MWDTSTVVFWYSVVCGLSRRKEASRLSGIVVANGWWIDPDLGEPCPYCLRKTVSEWTILKIVTQQCTYICGKRTAEGPVGQDTRQTEASWVPNPLLHNSQALEISQPSGSGEAAAKPGWKCHSLLTCFRNSPPINLMACTTSLVVVFTLICSQDHPFPWAFQLHCERTSRTKVRKLIS